MKQIADFLKNYRLKKNIGYDELIKKTTLTPHVIRLIEEGDFSSIGAPFYIKNFLSQYCVNIGLTESETEEIIRKIIDSLDEKKNFFKTSETKKSRTGWVVGLMAVVVVVVGFLLLRTGSGKDFPVSKKVSGKASSFSSTIKNDNRWESEGKKQPSSKQKTKKEALNQNESLKNNFPENRNVSSMSDIRRESRKEINDKTPEDLIPGREEKIEKTTSTALERAGDSSSDGIVEDLSANGTVKVLFKASCMCWVNISLNDKVLKDFILKENENFSVKVPRGAKITIGNAKCLRLFFDEKEVKLPDTKVVKDLMVE